MIGSGVAAVRRASASDWQSVRQLLVDAGLPIEDIGSIMLDDFLIAETGGSIVGVVGLQKFEKIGLLRSLVVAERARRSGLGGLLLGALEAAARTTGINQLWLLTIDADLFFARQGFEITPREQAPLSIRQTEEFRGLCPADAHLMSKSIG
jgi:amino-acid N-acetyltransferase